MAENTSNDIASLAPRDTFGKSANTTIVLSKIIDVNTVKILGQPNFDHLKGAEQIQDHQKATKVTAETWHESVRSALFSCNDAIIAYDSQFSSFYDSMLGFANDIGPDKKKTAEAKRNLIAALNELKIEINRQHRRTTQAGIQLKDFLTSMMAHSADAASDMKNICAKYVTDTGQISSYIKLMKANDVAMNNYLAIIGGGVGVALFGATVITAGVCAWFESAGTAIPLISIGVLIELFAGVAAGCSVKDYIDKTRENAKLKRELMNIKSEVAVAQHLLSNVESLVTSIQNVDKAADSLSHLWSQLGRDYDIVIETLKSTDVEKLRFVIVNHLHSAKKAWGELSDDAHLVKKNLFAGPRIDDNAAKQAKPGQIVPLPGYPNDNAIPHTTSLLDCSVPVKRTSVLVSDSEHSNMKAWLKEASHLILDVDQLLQTSSSLDFAKAPQNIIATKLQLSRLGESSLNSATEFISSLEDLSKLAPILRQTAHLPDGKLIMAGLAAFKQLSVKIDSTKSVGAVALKELNAEVSGIFSLKAAINSWLTSLEQEKASETNLINEAIQLRDEAEREREKNKHDLSWYFLGAVACIAVAIEQSQKISSANTKISELNHHISETSNELSQVTATMSSVNSLDSKTTLLMNCLDQVLKIEQMIFVSVNGIVSNYDSTTSFVIRAHLNVIANQIDGFGYVLSHATSNMMMLALRSATENAERNDSMNQNKTAYLMNTGHISLLKMPRSLTTSVNNIARSSSNNGDNSLLRDMQQLTSDAMNLQSSAMLASTQPKLAYVETLLQQDQQLLVGHALQWRLYYSSTIIGVLGQLRSLGDIILFMLESIQEFVDKCGQDNINKAVQGLESIDTDMSRNYQFLFQSQMIASQFLHNCIEDESRFRTVADQLRIHLKGEHGQMKALEDEEANLSLQLTEALESVVNRSTQMLVEALEWEAVFAMSMALSGIEFAAVNGAVVMNVVKKGVNVALKKASQVGTNIAKERLASLVKSQDAIVAPIIEKRAETLMAMSQLSVDLSSLHVLLGSQKSLVANSKRLVQTLADLAMHFSEQKSHVYAIKLQILAGKKDQALMSINSLSTEWKTITSAANSLEQSFVASF